MSEKPGIIKVLSFALVGFTALTPAIISADEGQGKQVSGEKSTENANVKNFVSSLGDQVLSIISDNNVSDEQKETQLENMFRENVDTNWMGVFALGRHFKALRNDADKKKYLELYSDYLVASYVPRFRDYTGENFTIDSVKQAESAGEFVVKTTIKSHDQGPDTKVDYRVRKDKGGSYKVIDIVGEGVSLITTHRTDFGSIISQNGLDGFIKRLENKVASYKQNKTATAKN